MRRFVVPLLLLLSLPGSVRAQAQGAGSDLNFDLMGDTPKQTQQQSAEQMKRILEVDRQSKIRRNLLLAHQAIGFATLGALAATLVIGQLNYMDLYVNGDFSGRYRQAHLGLGIGTTAMFAATGILALAAPNPYPKKIKFDTALIHKISMAMATAGMATMMILGPVTHARVGHPDQASVALGHLITGYATFAFMATGVVAYFF